MHQFIENLKRQASENPVFTLATAAAVAQAASKLMSVNTERKKAKTNAKEIDRRIRKLEKSK